MGNLPLRVTLIGAGQVGRAVAKALRFRGIPHRLLAFRRGLPRDLPGANLILLTVRDSQIEVVARAMLERTFDPRSIVAHVSGPLGPEVLAPIRGKCRGLGQLHPFSSIRGSGHPNHFARVHFMVAGDPQARLVLRRLVRQLDGIAIDGTSVDRARYHLAAALLANGTIALLHEACELLVRAGIPPRRVTRMVIDLEQSVLGNVSVSGIDAALTGPVRRGDVSTVRAHLQLLGHRDAATRNLYRDLVLSQLDIVSGLGELNVRQLRQLKRLLGTV